MKRVTTILAYAFVTTLCGCAALLASHLVFQTNCDAAGYISFSDKIMCAALAVVICSLVLAFIFLYDRYKLYKSFYHSMVRRIERFRIL
ncbi:MAG TPA: hypothetical protein VMX13_04470 [Sedimentisphaerales bacterium]|nr:hypothetical protein [Sedimentisphaerales bacterium]